MEEAKTYDSELRLVSESTTKSLDKEANIVEGRIVTQVKDIRILNNLEDIKEERKWKDFTRDLNSGPNNEILIKGTSLA